jgi:hypothetical protein
MLDMDQKLRKNVEAWHWAKKNKKRETEMFPFFEPLAGIVPVVIADSYLLTM